VIYELDAGSLGGEMTLTAAATYAGDADAPAHARRWCRNQLAGSFPPSKAVADLLDDIELVVSELATNAVRAGCVEFSVTVSADHGLVRIAVTDAAEGTPTLMHAAFDDVHGRGLAIVSALAGRWGVSPSGGEKQVWAEFPIGDRH
jgi:anti-sigma regulatory factor (Ser/Thr protein kinase)